MTMDDEQRALVDQILNREEIGGDVLLEMERMGDVAFDEIHRRLSSSLLSPRQQVLALRRLARITRQARNRRKEELLDLAVERLKSDSRIVRSGAANIAIWTAATLEKNPNLVTRDENRSGATPSLRERIRSAIAEAVNLGLDETQDKFSRDYLGC
jgi:hypothetical protein